MFGVEFRWQGADAKTARWLASQIGSVASRMGEGMDPDCIWRNPPGGCTNSQSDLTATLEARAAELYEETGHVYDIHRKTESGREVRDFAGLSQGWVLEELARSAPGPFLGDFAGDVFISEGMTPLPELGIADPLAEHLPYARVDMQAGWMIAATASDLEPPQTHTRHQLGPTPPAERRFERVVLFAEPSFEGWRLDAWSTAVVEGGPATLERLEQIEPLQGRWAWFVLDSRGLGECSKALECSLESAPRSVRVRW